jgi:hypothetical protein
MANYSFTIQNSTEGQVYNQTINWGDSITIGAGTSSANHYANLNTASGINRYTATTNTNTLVTTGNRNFNGQFSSVIYYAHGSIPTSQSSPVTFHSIRAYKDGTFWFSVNVTVVYANQSVSVPSTAIAEGSNFNITYTNPYSANLSYNSTGDETTKRINPRSLSRGLGGGTNQTYTANATFGTSLVLEANGSKTFGVSLRLGGTGAEIIGNSNTGTVYRPVALGSISISESSRNDTTGSFVLQSTVTGAETISGHYPVEHRFRIDNAADAALCTTRGVPAPGTVVQGFSSTSTCSLDGKYRGIPIEVQHRIVGDYNNTGGSAYTSPITIPIIAEDTTFTASSPTISWDAATFTTTLTGVQIGDEVRAVLTSNTGVIFENFTTVTATTFNLVCNNATVNSTNLPNGSATSVRIQVRRPIAAGGDGNSVAGPTFNVTRNYREGPFANVFVTTPTGGSTTIGAQKFNAYDIGQSEQVRVTGSGVISGADYIGTIISGTTQGGATTGTVYNQTASGTEPNAATTAGGCAFSQLPTPGNSCSYRITCIIPTSLGGDGSTPQACYDSLIFVPGQETEWTITRSNYVTPNLVTGPFSISGVFSTGSTNTYVLGFNDTANKSWTVSSTQTNQVYKVVEGGTDYDTFGTGNSSLSGTFLNSDIPVSDGLSYVSFFLETAVPTINDGTGVYSNCTESGGSPLVFAFVYREVAYTTPTINAINAVMETGDLSKIVPYVQLTDSAGNTAAYIDFVWSTTTPNPTTGWFNPSGSLSMTGYHSANFSLDKFSSGSTPANYTVYFGVRARSNATGATSTASYTSFSVVGANYVLDPGGGLADGYLNRENEENNSGNTNLDGYITDRSDILLENTDTLNETVLFESLNNPNSINTVAQSDYRNSSTSVLFTVVSPQTQYFIDVISGSVPGGATNVAVSLLPIGGTSDTYTLSNPSELPVTGNTTTYKFYRRQLQNQGGDGTTQVPAQDQTVAEFSARRRTTPDDTITVTVPDFNLTPSQSGDMTITIADGNSSTEYQIRSYNGSDANSDSSLPTIPSTIASRAGNGTLTIPFASLPAEGDTISYKIRFRELGSGAIFIDVDTASTNNAFNIGRLQDFTITDGANNTGRATSTDYDSNSITLNGISQALGTPVPSTATETVRVRDDSNPTGAAPSWVASSVNGGTLDNSDKTVGEGDTIEFRLTTSANTVTTRTLRATFLNSGHIETWALETGGGSGGGSGTGDPGAAGNYGLQVFNSSGDTLVNQQSRLSRFVESNSISVNGSGGSQTITSATFPSIANLTNSTAWSVVVFVQNSFGNDIAPRYTVSVGSGQFTITNNTPETEPLSNDDRRLFRWYVFKNG